jgi:hypothetical protein
MSNTNSEAVGLRIIKHPIGELKERRMVGGLRFNSSIP